AFCSVRNIYTRCGHAENLPPIEVTSGTDARTAAINMLSKVKCESTHCKFSPNHPEGCVPPYCSTTCHQYRLFPEQY
ncbi:hypothetical protein GGX14DRAFT_315930, partial [Mycena pura]